MQPNDEAFRLQTLKTFDVLDTTAERVFDDLTRLASTIAGTPISLVSLVDEHRQWFKSNIGLDGATETPREHAFCAHAIQSNEPMVVENALDDDRFHDNPLVVSDPNIRFYAGLPLIVSDNVALGTLCVIDTEPRQLSDEQLGALSVLRDAVVAQLELRRTLKELGSLQSLLPMCAWCRKVKDESQPGADPSWVSLDEFLSRHGAITHGICPSCTKDLVGRSPDGQIA